jgi:hypothetical protein
MTSHDAYALRAGLARLYARMRMHTPSRSGTHTHAHADQYVILLFHSNNGFVNPPQCCVTRTLSVLFVANGAC